jgi:hypothetical protein
MRQEESGCSEMFRNKDKRAAANAALRAEEAANAALRAEVERLEALPMAQLAAEVMVKGFEQFGPYHSETAYSVAEKYAPEGSYPYGADRDRLYQVVGEAIQVLEHQSLIWVSHVNESRHGVHYALTRRGRAALEDNAVEQALRGASAEPGPFQ